MTLTPPATTAISPGSSYPLGAYFDGAGTNFALFSSLAEKIELCLIDETGAEERLPLPRLTSQVWHGYVEGVGPGQKYGFRVHGPGDAGDGTRCDPAVLLIDPYARAFAGEFADGKESEGTPQPALSVVTSPFFDWQGDRRPHVPDEDLVIYEAHVKGMTMRHPDVPEKLRGTYAGLAHPAVVGYLKDLGVNAVELLPIQQFHHDGRLRDLGLANYWGYNTYGFFAPHNGYASSSGPADVVTEFKSMVRAFHEAGIHVLLDVVYNHTAEGNRNGPTMSFRGIDNPAYYHLSEEDPAEYADFTGTGNSVNAAHPRTLQLIMDSLRYWVEDMHVDGFRFDLATTLLRDRDGRVDPDSSFLHAVLQDPVLNQVKLIAEPWDVGPDGYQLGKFPIPWREWNGDYRDTIRDFWRGEKGTLTEFASRITGSSDLYAGHGHGPASSINFVTAHDGFTLRDLVSYDEKHNDNNREDNRDGENHNRSWNHGAEGPTDDADINRLRHQQQLNFLTTLLLSIGTPMLSHGDEIGRTQGGNNNAYCQDNEIAWMDWSLLDEEDNAHLHDFTRRVLYLRNRYPVFRRTGFLTGGPDDAPASDRDIAWLTPDGELMGQEDWDFSAGRALMVYLGGAAASTRDSATESAPCSSFLLIFNAYHEEIEFTLPAEEFGAEWIRVIDTTQARGYPVDRDVSGAGGTICVQPRSTLVFQQAIGAHDAPAAK